MRRIALSALLPVVLLGVSALAADSGTKRTLHGTWIWFGGDDGDLEATFTPTGQTRWDVSFQFSHGGSRHTYAGTAEGSLDRGLLSGRVVNENGRRTFTFRGEFQDGELTGTHSEIIGSREQRTGTLTLSSGS